MRNVFALLFLILSLGANAQTQINALPAGSALTGTEAIPADQGSSTVKTTPAAIADYLLSSSSDTEVLLNESGFFGGDSGLTYNATTNTLRLSSIVSSAGENFSATATSPTAATGASQAGKKASLTASAAVASTDTAGAAAGGDVDITAGAAARFTSGNANGGNINLVTGAGIGTGTAGQILISDDGTAAKPALAFDVSGNTSYGISYSSGAIQFSVNGALAASVNNSGFSMAGGSGVIGNATTPGPLFGFKRQRFNLSSSTTLTSGSYNGATLTNSTAGAGITSTLVTAAAGYNHRMLDDNATHRWTIKPNTSDTIIWTDGTVVTAATGSIVSTGRYDMVDLEAIDATVWIASNVRGTWTVTP